MGLTMSLEYKGRNIPILSFSCFFLNIRITRCLFSEFVLFCISLSCLLGLLSSATRHHIIMQFTGCHQPVQNSYWPENAIDWLA